MKVSIWELFLAFYAGICAGIVILTVVRIFSKDRDRITGSAGHF